MGVFAERVAGVEPLLIAVAAVGERSISKDDAMPFLEDPASVGIVGSVDGRPAGYLVAYLVRRFDGHAMLIVYDVAVADGDRRQGVGTAMIEEALEIARRSGCSKAWVVADRANEAVVGLYRATGAHPTATDELVMWWQP